MKLRNELKFENVDCAAKNFSYRTNWLILKTLNYSSINFFGWKNTKIRKNYIKAINCELIGKRFAMLQPEIYFQSTKREFKCFQFRKSIIESLLHKKIQFYFSKQSSAEYFETSSITNRNFNSECLSRTKKTFLISEILFVFLFLRI